ncbi:hypothetical protein SARC_15189, partial [Sphaeroforma arctica JP610]
MPRLSTRSRRVPAHPYAELTTLKHADVPQGEDGGDSAQGVDIRTEPNLENTRASLGVFSSDGLSGHTRAETRALQQALRASRDQTRESHESSAQEAALKKEQSAGTDSSTVAPRKRKGSGPRATLKIEQATAIQDTGLTAQDNGTRQTNRRAHTRKAGGSGADTDNGSEVANNSEHAGSSVHSRARSVPIAGVNSTVTTLIEGTLDGSPRRTRGATRLRVSTTDTDTHTTRTKRTKQEHAVTGTPGSGLVIKEKARANTQRRRSSIAKTEVTTAGVTTVVIGDEHANGRLTRTRKPTTIESSVVVMKEASRRKVGSKCTYRQT